MYYLMLRSLLNILEMHSCQARQEYISKGVEKYMNYEDPRCDLVFYESRVI